MPTADDESYEEARKMAEKALEAYAQGNKEDGDQLIEDATEINANAVQDIYEELEEDEESEHDPDKLTDNDAPDAA